MVLDKNNITQTSASASLREWHAEGVVDAYSKWPETIIVLNTISSVSKILQ